MTKTTLALLLTGLTLVGCGDSETGTTSVTTTSSSTTIFSSEMPTWTATENMSEDLSNGEIIDTSWADDSNIACWIGTEKANFSGSHVLFETSIDELTHMTIAVFPDTDVDVSLYVLMDADATPPDVTSAVSCEASADWQNNSNPGVTELVDIFAADKIARTVIIGVAGANGATSGGFNLSIWSEFYDPQ